MSGDITVDEKDFRELLTRLRTAALKPFARREADGDPHHRAVELERSCIRGSIELDPRPAEPQAGAPCAHEGRGGAEPGIGTLAYLGDAVFELWIRLSLASGKPASGAELHHRAVQRVRARSQASLLKQIEDKLTQAELDLVRRGRNAKVGVVPRSARPVEYRLATALEALFGHLLWIGDIDRLVQLLVLSNGCIDDLEEDV